MNAPVKKALIVDDEPDIRELLEITLGRMSIETSAAADLASARALLADVEFDLCLTDMHLPDGNGLELVQHISAEQPGLPVAVITAFGSIDTAISALKAGAFDFVQNADRLTKPLIRREDGELHECEWDEALDFAANGFREAIDRHGRHSVYAVASGRAPHEAAYAMQKFVRAGCGTHYIDNCSRA